MCNTASFIKKYQFMDVHASQVMIYDPCSDKSVLNTLPNDKILDEPKLKAFSDNKLTHSHATPFDAPGK